MDLAADGSLIEGNDGGVYRRTKPRTNNGDWFSINGDLRTTEFHAVAWDAVADIAIGGAQDTGSPQERIPTDVKWRSISTADGGVVAVDDTSTPGQSTRYSSNQYLSGFRRRVYDANNVLQSEVFLNLTVLGGGVAPNAQFYTPIALNAASPNRLAIGAANGVYESDDQGDTVIQIATIAANQFGHDPIAFGAQDNAVAIYVGAGDRVHVRLAAPPAQLQPTAYQGGQICAIGMDPARHKVAYVADEVDVFRTADAGVSWVQVTGNLAAQSPGKLHSLAYSTHDPQGMIVVGADSGVFAAPGPGFNNWAPLGADLPHAPVFHLEYDPADDLLLAGTLGRGAWTLAFGAGGGGAQPESAAKSAPERSKTEQ